MYLHRDNIYNILKLILIIITVSAIVLFTTFLANCISTSITNSQNQEQESVEETTSIADQIEQDSVPTYVWEFSKENDLQLPELPTGCEATSASTLLRMNGIEVSKTEIADSIPQSDSDYVHAFWGNPYYESGWACMSPAIEDVMNKFISENQTVVRYEGYELKDVPLPCQVWVTMSMTIPLMSSYDSEGYPLAYNTHCVVITEVEGDLIHYIDPLEGECSTTYREISEIYETLGSQAIYIKNNY